MAAGSMESQILEPTVKPTNQIIALCYFHLSCTHKCTSPHSHATTTVPYYLRSNNDNTFIVDFIYSRKEFAINRISSRSKCNKV